MNDRSSQYLKQVAGATTAALVFLSGCSRASDEPNASQSGQASVAVSTDIWASVVSSIDCESQLEVITLIPPGSDPHGFELSLQARQTMDSSHLVVANGLGLEGGLSATLESVEIDGTPVLLLGDELLALGALSEGPPTQEPQENEHHDEEDHQENDHDADEHDAEHDHGSVDPHFWFDPTLISQAVPILADHLIDDAGLDPDTVHACVAQFEQELATLDTEVAQVFSTVPTDQRTIVTNHDSLSYLANRYELQVIGTVLPGSSSLAETSPAALEDLIALIEQTQTRAIFSETHHASHEAESLGDKLGVEVIQLNTSSLGPDSKSYADWLRTIAQTMATALN